MSDREALKVFSRQPVSQDMVSLLVSTTSSVIQVKNTKQASNMVPAGSPSSRLIVRPTNKTVPLHSFITKLIKYSNVQTPTLMATLVYLNRTRNLLPANAVGMETTRHRVFLAALILSAKSLNDSSPLNKHWTKYTDGLLSLAEVNMAERELIGLLKWDLVVKEDELVVSLQPFLKSIKHTLAKKVQAEADAKASYYRLSYRTSPRGLASPAASTSSESSPSSPLSPYRMHSSASISSCGSAMSLASHPHGSCYSLRGSNSAYTLKSTSSSYYNLHTIPDETHKHDTLRVPPTSFKGQRV